MTSFIVYVLVLGLDYLFDCNIVLFTKRSHIVINFISKQLLIVGNTCNIVIIFLFLEKLQALLSKFFPYHSNIAHIQLKIKQIYDRFLTDIIVIIINELKLH